MEPTGYGSLSFEDVVSIVKNRYRPGHLVLIEAHVDRLWRTCHSLPELLEQLDGELEKSMNAAHKIDPANQKLIDKRFCTLVINELAKRFGDDLHLVSNLQEIVNTGSTLKEIQLRVQYEINTKKLGS
jgi:hypothetical protein